MVAETSEPGQAFADPVGDATIEAETMAVDDLRWVDGGLGVMADARPVAAGNPAPVIDDEALDAAAPAAAVTAPEATRPWTFGVLDDFPQPVKAITAAATSPAARHGIPSTCITSAFPMLPRFVQSERDHR